MRSSEDQEPLEGKDEDASSQSPTVQEFSPAVGLLHTRANLTFNENYLEGKLQSLRGVCHITNTQGLMCT